MQNTGERQVAETLSGIKANHIQRYKFAIDQIQEKYSFDSKSVLDAACGNGYGSYLLGMAGHGVVSVDVSAEAIEVAKKAYSMETIRHEVLDLQDDDAWPFADTRFDAIVSIETIEHVTNPESLIKRFADSTDLLLCSVPNEDVVQFDKDIHPFHHRHYTKSQFEELLNNAGFHVEGWWTQYDKVPGIVYDNDDGMGFLVVATKTPVTGGV